MASTSYVEAHLELVERVVRRLTSELDLSCDTDDLRAWGQQGLIEASQRFDPDRGVRFSTFAYYRVRGAVLDGVRKQGWVPRRAYEKMRALEATDATCEASGEAVVQGAAPSLAERAGRIDDALAKISVSYVLAAVGQEQEADEQTPETLFDQREDGARVQEELAALPDNERSLIRSVYFEGKTIEQAGALLGLSKSWASRLHGKALERMRRALVREDGGARATG